MRRPRQVWKLLAITETHTKTHTHTPYHTRSNILPHICSGLSQRQTKATTKMEPPAITIIIIVSIIRFFFSNKWNVQASRM